MKCRLFPQRKIFRLRGHTLSRRMVEVVNRLNRSLTAESKILKLFTELDNFRCTWRKRARSMYESSKKLVESVGSVVVLSSILCGLSMAQTTREPTSDVHKSRKQQIITFALIPAQTAKSTVALTATASSGLTVNLTSLTPATCSISGSVASLLAAGTCTIRANQAGNEGYAAARMVTQSIWVGSASSNSGLFDITRAGAILQDVYPPTPPLPPPPSVCPFPTVVSVSPNRWIAGKTYRITVTGTGFTSPAEARESCPIPWFTAGEEAGSAILLNATILNSTTMIGTVAIAEAAPEETAKVILWYPPPQDNVAPSSPPDSKR